MKLFFSVDQPKMDKRQVARGEDAPPVSEDGIMIICDGTGATGQSEHKISNERYPEGIYTSAYLGSRETSRLAEKYLKENYDKIMSSFSDSNSEDLKFAVQNLGKTIQDGLDAFRRENHLELTVRGKSFKLLSTTFTAVVYRACDECIETIVLCAGDSHALWWDCEGGLCQLSLDGNMMEEGLAEGDCKISNCISADSDFCINYISYRLPPKGILLVTSDGFTDPITFFEQERFLIKWIREFGGSGETSRPGVRGLSDAMSEQIDQIGFSKRDDCSLSGVIAGYQDSRELNESIDRRLAFLEPNYFQPFQELKHSRKQLEQTLVEAQKKRIDAIREGIEGFIDCANPKGTDERLQVLLATDALRFKKQEFEKEAKGRQQRVNELVIRTYDRYKDFLKALCTLRPKKQSKRFPKELISAVNQNVGAEEKIEKLLGNCNDRLNRIKNFPEIRQEIRDFTSQESVDEINRWRAEATSFYHYMEDLRSEVNAYNDNVTVIEKFFDNMGQIGQYLQEDCGNNFQEILSCYHEPDIRSNFLDEAKNEILELWNQVGKLREGGINSEGLAPDRNLIKSCSGEIAKELLRKGEYAAFISSQNASDDFADRLDDIIADQNELKRKYGEQYRSRIRSAEIKSIEVKKKKNLDNYY